MILTARILTDVGGVNTFKYTDAAQFTEGDGPAIYFQLIDSSVDQDMRPRGRRYMPIAGATLQCLVQDIDDAKTVTRFATQPFSQDPSIWMLQLLPTDQVKGTSSLKLTLTEGQKVMRGIVDVAIRAESQIRGR